MSAGVPINPPRRCKTYLAADLDDVNGIKTAVSTVASDVEYGAADFNGSAVANSGTSWAGYPRTVTISRSSATGSYTTDPIVLTGKRGGVDVTESLTPANANGGDILRGTQAWDAPPTIAIPAQVDTAGQFQIGVQDICSPSPSETFVMVVFRGTAGQMNVQFGDDSASGRTDSFALPKDAPEVLAFSRVLTASTLSSPTAQNLTVYSS